MSSSPGDGAAAAALLGNNDLYLKANAANEKGSYREALQLFTYLRSSISDLQAKAVLTSDDLQPLIDKCYGVKGSDGTISLWDDAPLSTKTEPPVWQLCAFVQVGRKLYRHG